MRRNVWRCVQCGGELRKARDHPACYVALCGPPCAGGFEHVRGIASNARCFGRNVSHAGAYFVGPVSHAGAYFVGPVDGDS